MTFSETTPADGDIEDGRPLQKVAVVAVLANIYAGAADEDLSRFIDFGAEIGEELASRAVAALAPATVESYGKAAVVGIAGEQEHGVALLTSAYGDAVRRAVGGGKAWISSFTKRAAPGVTIDVPLAFKDALYVRSHYDGMTITLHDAPLPNEVAVICAVASRGRIGHRVGGPRRQDVKGEDGLR
jgi:hypothetical protein